MDRDPQANVVDSEDRATPSDGRSPFGEAGDQRARTADEREPDADEGKEERAGRRSPATDPLHTPLPPD